MADTRCPATTRHVPSHSVSAVGVQCKFTKGHDGAHAGHASFSEGDVFWPNEPQRIQIVPLAAKRLTRRIGNA